MTTKRKILGNDGKFRFITLGEYYSFLNNGFISKDTTGTEVLNLYEKPKDKTIEEVRISPEVLDKFKDKNLLKLIHKELSKTHLDDDKIKMTTFLVATSGLLNNQKRRMSLALKGDSTVGKDNIINTVLKHMPTEVQIFVTSATKSTIEDDIMGKRIIAFSEVNLNKEDGANRSILETIKQKSEGGTRALKKDIRTGMKESRFEIGEQGSVLYGTTEVEKDKEVDTRFIEGFVEAPEKKVTKVNEDTIEDYSDLNRLFTDGSSDSWIREGLTYFHNRNPPLEVYLPFAKVLKDNLKDIIDNKSPRSMRDLKRLLGITTAMTYLFQEQRKIIDFKGKEVLVGEPEDFINTLQLSAELFNQTYSGLDMRLLQVLKIINEVSEEWVARDLIQERIGCATNTIKHYCDILAGEGCIKGIKGSELNIEKAINMYDGNRIYYTRYQKGIKKPLIRYQVSELKKLLEEKTEKAIDTLEDDWFIDDKEEENKEKRYQKKGIKLKKDECKVEEIGEKDSISGEIDTLELTPLPKFSAKEVKK